MDFEQAFKSPRDFISFVVSISGSHSSLLKLLNVSNDFFKSEQYGSVHAIPKDLQGLRDLIQENPQDARIVLIDETVEKDPVYAEILPSIGSKVAVVSDLHGDFEIFLALLSEMLDKNSSIEHWVFLGDFIDRGFFSLEIVVSLLMFIQHNPKKITLLLGNHENQVVEPMGFSHFSEELTGRFKEGGGALFDRFMQIFQCFPVFVLTHCLRFMFVHASPPFVGHIFSETKVADYSVAELRELLTPTQKRQMLWGDLASLTRTTDGATELFLYDANRSEFAWEVDTSLLFQTPPAFFRSKVRAFCFTEEVLPLLKEKLGVEYIIRGHQHWPLSFASQKQGHIYTVTSGMVREPFYALVELNPAKVEFKSIYRPENASYIQEMLLAVSFWVLKRSNAIKFFSVVPYSETCMFAFDPERFDAGKQKLFKNHLYTMLAEFGWALKLTFDGWDKVFLYVPKTEENKMALNTFIEESTFFSTAEEMKMGFAYRITLKLENPHSRREKNRLYKETSGLVRKHFSGNSLKLSFKEDSLVLRRINGEAIERFLGPEILQKVKELQESCPRQPRNHG